MLAASNELTKTPIGKGEPMYQIGICDDEPVFIQHAVRKIEEIMHSHGIPCQIHAFQNLAELDAHLQCKSLDLLFLDILFQEDNGMDFARRLKKNGNEIPIIFLTCSMDFVLDGYTVEAVGYLVKPILPDKLAQTLLRAYQKYKKNMVVIQSASQTFSLKSDEVLYLEIENKKLSIHMTDGTVSEALIPLNVLLQKLPPDQFVQCHRSYVISLASVCSICRYVVELKNHEKIPISKKNYKNVQSALLSWTASLD